MNDAITLSINSPYGALAYVETVFAILGEHHISRPFGDGTINDTQPGRIHIQWWNGSGPGEPTMAAAAEDISRRYPQATVEYIAEWITSADGLSGEIGGRYRDGRLVARGASEFRWTDV